MKTLIHDEYKGKVSKLKTLDDLNNFAKELISPVLQECLRESYNFPPSVIYISYYGLSIHSIFYNSSCMHI